METHKQWLDLDQLEDRLCVVIAEQIGLDRDEVNPESRIIEDLNCDSLDMIELIMETEDEFDITIPETPSTAVGKMIFTRTPFRVRDLAEFAFLNQGSGKPERGGWKTRKSKRTASSEREFTQLGGRFAGEALSRNQWLEPIEEDAPTRRFRRSIDGMICVEVPSARVTLGSDDPQAMSDEHPSHRVHLDAFLIDIEPVSVIAFCRFLNSIEADPREVDHLVGLSSRDPRITQLQFERKAERWRAKEGVGMQPVVLVSWFAASAYSRWVNGCDWRELEEAKSFLPSEAQWELAASGA